MAKPLVHYTRYYTVNYSLLSITQLWARRGPCPKPKAHVCRFPLESAHVSMVLGLALKGVLPPATLLGYPPGCPFPYQPYGVPLYTRPLSASRSKAPTDGGGLSKSRRGLVTRPFPSPDTL